MRGYKRTSNHTRLVLTIEGLHLPPLPPLRLPHPQVLAESPLCAT